MQDPTQQPLYLGLAGHEQPWSSRRIRIAQDLISEGVVLAGTSIYIAQIQTFPVDIFFVFLGFQEALHHQALDLNELLGDDWAWVRIHLQGIPRKI